MKVTLERFTEEPVQAIEEAASTCYDSTPTNGRIMNHCYASGHHSVLEFANFTFKIEGISRACTHQLVRHRSNHYAQRSQRYCVENGFSYVTPPTIARSDKASEVYNDCMSYLHETYDKLVSIGIPAEDARMVLPNACCSVIRVNLDGRNLIHLCNERLCACAQWEIRKVVKLMVEEVIKVAPELEPFLVPKCEAHYPYCFCTESKNRSCGKHPLLKDVVPSCESITE